VELLMRDDLAEKVLAHVMSWDSAQIAQFGACLQDLARYKYDEYEGFGPGEKFVESLAAWLWQLEPGERADAIHFVLTSLVFVSRLELDHVIGMVYPDVIRPILIRRAAQELSLPPYKVAKITASREFRELERKTLVLGLADGSRLDRLRRASPKLSHEQVYLAPEIGDDTRQSMHQKLTEALQKRDLDGPAEFRQVILVDDFSGSGYTLLHWEKGRWDGKLVRLKKHLNELITDKLVASDAAVCLILYLASASAYCTLKERIDRARFGWDLEVVQILPDFLSQNGKSIAALSQKYFDPVLRDEHKDKGGNPALGFGGVALPVVLHHNTPNNSVGLLWADTSERDDGANRRALFPRRERHNPERP
jgi:hypothetical protein